MQDTNVNSDLGRVVESSLSFDPRLQKLPDRVYRHPIVPPEIEEERRSAPAQYIVDWIRIEHPPAHIIAPGMKQRTV